MKYQKKNISKFNILAMSILLLSLPAISYADVQIQDTSLIQKNGVKIVDINKANSNGISHNIYNNFNVDKKGWFFNNSQYGTNTELAGQIKGNANLVSGTAKVIINEVTSKNKSTLNGYMEVAGDKAYLIVANPNGISCTNCGFINTNGATLTTGKVDIQNGALKGYSVNGGQIQISNLTSDSPTAILARSALISGNVRSKDITIVTGSNYVNPNNEVKSYVGASGSQYAYSIDISQLGGMYANKISLVSTENGVGVRNEGTISAGSGGIKLDGNGYLINISSQFRSVGDITINTAANIDNMVGQITSNKSVSISTSGNINNINGQITGTKGVTIKSALLANNLAEISSTEGNINIKSSDSVYNMQGIIKSNLGSINIEGKGLYNSYGLIKGRDININVWHKY